jgi:hypothetical protein
LTSNLFGVFLFYQRKRPCFHWTWSAPGIFLCSPCSCVLSSAFPHVTSHVPGAGIPLDLFSQLLPPEKLLLPSHMVDRRLIRKCSSPPYIALYSRYDCRFSLHGVVRGRGDSLLFWLSSVAVVLKFYLIDSTKVIHLSNCVEAPSLLLCYPCLIGLVL